MRTIANNSVLNSGFLLSEEIMAILVVEGKWGNCIT